VAPIEQWSCASKQELEIRERHWIDELKPQLNCQKPAACALAGGMVEYQKEWYQANKEKIAEQQKQWREANKEKQAEQKKQWQEVKVHCECGSIVTRGNLTKHRKSAKHQWVMQQISESGSV